MRVATPLVLLIALTTSAAAQKAPTVLESYDRARTLIEAAVQAHGGIDVLREARHLRVRSAGWDYHPTQGRRLAPPYDSTVRTSDVMIDLDRGAIVATQTTGWPGGFHYTTRFITRGDSTFSVQLRDDVFTILTAPRAEQQFGNLFAAPQWMVLAAYDNANPSIRRYLGRLRLGGTNTDVEAVHFTLPPQGNVIIGLDPRTHMLRAILSVGTDPFTGDAEIHTEFLDWKQIDGVLLPSRAVLRRAGNVVRELRYVGAQRGYQIPDSLLSAPAGFTLRPPSPQAPVQELAPGVWLAGPSSKSLVVAFEDHLVVVDAPASSSSDVIHRAPTLAPGKPIRYVVPTHHHDDHFMGVRYHAANGATIVTTPGNSDYLRRILNAPMASVMQRSNQVPPTSDYRAELISGGRRVFSDGRRTLELYQIASPHAEEMLVAWLPAEGILFQADLIEAPGAGIALRGANAEATTHLARFIREKGWDVKTFAGAHATLRSPDEFAKLVAQPILPP